MRPKPADPFFIGWARVPRALRTFLGCAAAGLLALFGATAFLLAASQDDPGGGGRPFGFEPQTVTGILVTEPYPAIHVTDAGRYPAGTLLLLSGQGKRGATDLSATLDGRLVRAVGIPLRRGSIDMLRLLPGAGSLTAVPAGIHALLDREPLGRWRISGEICDGRCYAGAMRPGRGLAHKACANLCLVGGAPPILVATDEVDGERFLVIADAGGGPIGDALSDWTAIPVRIDGEVERLGRQLVFRIDLATIRTR